MEHQVHDDASEKKTISRRQLLKALVAAGGAVTASTLLPGKWARPVVEVGALPAHAQASAPTSTPTFTPTLTPTSTPRPPYAIIGCYAYNAAGGGIITPTDVIQAYAEIAPAAVGIQLRRTITLNEPGHTLNGVISVVEGVTDASGIFQPADFDLNGLSWPITPGDDRLSVLWEFVDPAYGTNTCENLIDVVV